jgi:hypothetical protein
MTKNGNKEKETKNNTNKETVEETINGADLVTIDDQLLIKETEIDAEDYSSFLAVAKKLKEYSPTISISAKYYEFTQPGEQVRGVFLGTTTIKKKTETGVTELECIQWLAEDGNLYINAGAALLSTFRQFLPPRGCPIQITYQHKKERTKIYDVRVLSN